MEKNDEEANEENEDEDDDYEEEEEDFIAKEAQRMENLVVPLGVTVNRPDQTRQLVTFRFVTELALRR